MSCSLNTSSCEDNSAEAFLPEKAQTSQTPLSAASGLYTAQQSGDDDSICSVLLSCGWLIQIWWAFIMVKPLWGGFQFQIQGCRIERCIKGECWALAEVYILLSAILFVFAVLSSLSALNYFFHSTTRDERKPQNLAHCKWRFMLFTWHWQFYHPTFDKLSSQMNYLYSYMYNTLSLFLLLPAM